MKMSFIAVVISTALLLSCKKDIAKEKQEDLLEAPMTSSSLTLTKTDYLKQIATFFLGIAESDVEFKKLVYAECGAQEFGDYYVKVPKILDLNAEQSYVYFSAEQDQYIRDIMDEIQAIDEEAGETYTDVTIFVPFIEDVNLDSLIDACSLEPTPETVIATEYDGGTCPGYTLSSGSLSHFGDVDEDYAWTHELWVFGQEEVLPADNMEAGRATNVQPMPESRFNGQQEKAGILQVTDLGSLEPWTQGKFEFRFFVFNASGTKTNEIALKKQQRKKFKDDKWVDFDKFLFNWNTSTIGNWTIEAWIEEDGGNSTSTVSQTLPPPCTGCPSTTISFSKQKHDDIMGQSIVQFTDAITTVYSISYSNFKRKN